MSTWGRLLTRTHALESTLTSAFERTAQAVAGSNAPAPLELIERAARELARHVHPAGRGRYVCPFNEIGLTFVAATPDDQARFEAICAGPPSVRDRLRERLASAGCVDVHLDVRVDYVVAADPAWPRPDFHLSLGRAEPTAATERSTTPRVDVRITRGTADRGAYSFSTLPIAIGRGPEVRDGRLQLVRVNHIAFAEDGDQVNLSVSRRHARIELDAASGRLRVIDDNSAQGTTILRGGVGMPVPRGSRGLALQCEDEIVLGQARLRVRVTRASHGHT